MFLTEFARAVELVAIGERVALVAIRAMTKFSSWPSPGAPISF